MPKQRTLALQIAPNRDARGLQRVIFTRDDRAGEGKLGQHDVGLREEHPAGGQVDRVRVVVPLRGPSFLEEFADHAKIHDRNGPNGAPRIEFEIPVDKLDRFNELTQNRSWVKTFGGPN